MLATVRSSVLIGAEGQPITVEVHVTNGLPSLNIVGLPDISCRESRDRVRAALVSSGFKWPQRRITVNLAPSHVRKAGSALDLPIAIGILVADEQLPSDCVEGVGVLGELSLDGGVRPVLGMIPLAECIKARQLVVPPDNQAEAGLVASAEVVAEHHLAAVAACLAGRSDWPRPRRLADPLTETGGLDLADVCGQQVPRLALEIAAGGGHHLLMSGPPGSGKTMLAARLPGILPDLNKEEAVEVTRIHTAAGIRIPHGTLVRRPPFRAPHHTASVVSLIGGGTFQLRPGEISAAHRGVLFLDELGEYPHDVVDALREPLEEGSILVSRAKASVRFPARFILVAATNPCHCGCSGPGAVCSCSQEAVTRYRARISGPLLDRFDLRVSVTRPDADELLGRAERGESSAAVAERVRQARDIARFRGWSCNAAIPGALVASTIKLSEPAERYLEAALRKGQLSARGFHRLRRVARTIADLRGEAGPVSGEDVEQAHALRESLYTDQPLEPRTGAMAG